MNYFDIYKKRLNRYGTDYKTRIQNQREKEFDDYLVKSVYRIDFEYNDELTAGTFERYKQDDTQTLSYLLTRIDTLIKPGTILQIPDQQGITHPWMVYWLENIVASGYNRYVMIKLNRFLEWTDTKGITHSTWVYWVGSVTGKIIDTIKSATGAALYTEDENKVALIMPTQENLQKEDYLEIGEDNLKDAYVVVGYDRHSTDGIEYVTLDPVYKRDHSPVSENTWNDNYWIDGGEG
jgi:hypothetical protein